MTGKDMFDIRRKGLEEGFFAKHNQMLINKLHSENQSKQWIDSLSSVSGIKDTAVLKSLVEAKVKPETLVALTLYPLVFVAWADGKMEDKEKEAILRSAQKKGIDSSSPAYELLSSWLESSPPKELFTAWQSYLSSLKEKLTSDDFNGLKEEIINQTTEVAKSAGGFLGLQSISSEESNAISQLEKSF